MAHKILRNRTDLSRSLIGLLNREFRESLASVMVIPVEVYEVYETLPESVIHWVEFC